MTQIPTSELPNYNDWRVAHGMAPIPVHRTRKTRAIQVSDESWTSAVRQAADLGFKSSRGRTATGGSISDLIEALGNGLVHLEIGPSDDFTDDN